jgi:FtsP/CotA-like multicopper oxidase with cupredoxin domain
MRLSRRRLLASLGPLVAAAPAAALLTGSASADGHGEPTTNSTEGHDHAGSGELEPVSLDGPDSQLLPPAAGLAREYELVAAHGAVEIAKGVTYDAWTYNGTVPGPIIRATEGDVLRVGFRNDSPQGHTVHFHGTHPTDMDGSTKPVAPGEAFTYEFQARPAGLHLYHCHVRPLAEHLARGLYGVLIVDPKATLPAAQEFVMVLSGFDLDGDGRNELYAVNGRPFYYARHPITVIRGKPVRIYLANLTEYDPVSSFHLHAAFFRHYPTGTAREPVYTDTVTLAQGERCILEPEFPENGLYMFHPHQSSMADRGAMGWFNVAESEEQAARQLAGASSGDYADDLTRCAPCVGTLGAKAITIY